MINHRDSTPPTLLPPLGDDTEPASELEPVRRLALEAVTPIRRAQQPTPTVTSAGAAAFMFEETTAAGVMHTGWGELHARLEQEGIFVERGWTDNHYRWIVWKLACQQRVDLRPEAAQEDDAFEEIEQQECTATEQGSEDATMWQDGWEDDDGSEQYVQQLRAELPEPGRTSAAAPAAHAQPPPFSPETVLQQLRERHAREKRCVPVLRKVLERWPEAGQAPSKSRGRI